MWDVEVSISGVGKCMGVMVNGLHSGCFPASEGSKVRASGRCWDTVAFTLIKRCDPLISIMLTFRLKPPCYKADTLSLKHLVKVSNYWCHPDSLFTRLSQFGWVTAHGTSCWLLNIIKTQCEQIRRKTENVCEGTAAPVHHPPAATTQRNYTRS